MSITYVRRLRMEVDFNSVQLGSFKHLSPVLGRKHAGWVVGKLGDHGDSMPGFDQSPGHLISPCLSRAHLWRKVLGEVQDMHCYIGKIFRYKSANFFCAAAAL